MPELKSEVVSTAWGTIFSLVQEESKVKDGFFESFFSANQNRDDILEIAAFILAANPEIFSYFENYAENNPAIVEFNLFNRILPKTQRYGGQDVPVKIAKLIHKYYPLEKIIQSSSEEQSTERMIETLLFLEKYGTLTRY